MSVNLTLLTVPFLLEMRNRMSEPGNELALSDGDGRCFSQKRDAKALGLKLNKGISKINRLTICKEVMPMIQWERISEISINS